MGLPRRELLCRADRDDEQVSYPPTDTGSVTDTPKLELLEILMRAERRVGELMAAGIEDRAQHGGDRRSRDANGPLKPVTLAEARIDKHLADRARKLAKQDDKSIHFGGSVASVSFVPCR